jgi:transcriptional regulator with XRE-family HTH domain
VEETLVIGDRLRELREAKMLSQGDIENRTGLLRCYVSRVENNHTVPSFETLEKLARALEVPMYQLFHAGAASPAVQNRKLEDDDDWGVTGKDGAYVYQLAKALSQMTPEDRNLLFAMARKVSKHK